MRNKVLLSFILLLMTTSCRSLLLKTMMSKSVKTEVLYSKEDNKKIVLFPMVHLNHPEFYEDVKHKLDSLRKLEFKVFYESVSLDTTLYSKKEIDTLKWKLRKLLGFHLTKYNDKKNKSLPSILRNSNYEAQTKTNTGLTENDIKIDVPVDTLLQVYELKYDPIKLSTCDFLTGLKEEYHCDPASKKKRDFIIMDVRNQYIEHKVIHTKYKKIALVYGKNHFKELKKNFKEKGFKILEKEE